MVSYIDVTYNGRAEKATVKPQYQYDKGQKLRVHGVSEGVNVFVHYAVRGLTKPVVRIPSLENGAWVSAIPTALLAQSSPIVAYVYLTADDMAQTVYEVEIPIIKRPMPDGFDMTDDEIEDVHGLIAQIRGAAEDAKEVQSIVDELREALKEASAVAALSVNAQSISSDRPAYADLTKDADGNYNIAFGIPKGTSGVQMSNEEPTDPEVDVWINPNGESDFSGGLTDEQIAEAVAAYFKQHPIEGGVTEEQIANAVRDYLQQNPVEGGVNQEQLNQAVSEALAQAKQSGEFKGDKGDPGDDYVLTEEDKREIAEQAAEFVEVPEGGGVEIDDSAPSTDKVYSSHKVDDALSQLSQQMADYRTAVNLFDNSNFVDPVMQAGFNGMHGSEKYVIDRWLHLYQIGSAEKVSGGIALTGAEFYMSQKIGEDVRGKTLTFAVCLADGTVVCGAANVGDLSGSIIFAQRKELYLMLANGYFSVRAADGTYTIKWAALYEGEYTAETLPPYVPKGYAAELAACNVADTGCVERTLIQENTTYVATGFPANPTTASNTVYTTPADGIFYLFATRGETAGNTIRVYILKPSGETVAQFNIPAYYPYAMCCLTIPVKRGMKIKVDADSASATWMIREQKFFY